MKKLSIEVVVNEDMDTMEIKTDIDGFSNVDYSFCIYKILKQLYKTNKIPSIIAAETFLDEVKT